MFSPHGGKLISKVASEEERKDILKNLHSFTKIRISERAISDCEMIAIGSFSPLEGFMTKEEAEKVIQEMHLPQGILWAIPIILPISKDQFNKVQIGEKVILEDKQANPVALLNVKDKFCLDLEDYCLNVFKTTDTAHPGVEITMKMGNHFIGGEILLLNSPPKRDLEKKYFLTPTQVRELIQKRGWKKIVAFQTRNPIHRAHEYIIKSALEPLDGVLIHPLVGHTKQDDIPSEIRIKCYEVLLENYFNREKVIFSVLPTSMYYAGPREAVHHMIIRKNYGATHMILGRDHAGVGNYYGTYEAQEFVDQFFEELEIQPLKFEHAFYCLRCESMATQKTCPHPKEAHLHLSGTKVREMLSQGKSLPKEFSRPEVAKILCEWAKSIPK